MAILVVRASTFTTRVGPCPSAAPSAASMEEQYHSGLNRASQKAASSSSTTLAGATAATHLNPVVCLSAHGRKYGPVNVEQQLFKRNRTTLAASSESIRAESRIPTAPPGPRRPGPPQSHRRDRPATLPNASCASRSLRPAGANCPRPGLEPRCPVPAHGPRRPPGCGRLRPVARSNAVGGDLTRQPGFCLVGTRAHFRVTFL